MVFKYGAWTLLVTSGILLALLLVDRIRPELNVFLAPFVKALLLVICLMTIAYFVLVIARTRREDRRSGRTMR